MNKFLRKIFYDQQLLEIDKKIKKTVLETSDEEEEKQLRLLHKYIRLYHRWRQKMILLAAMAILILFVLLIVVTGVRAITKAVSGGDQKPKKQVQTEAETETETETETEGKAPLAAETKLTLTFTGDCILGTDENFYYDTGFTAYYDMYGADYFLENVRDIFQKDDLTIVNMEGTLTEETTREYKEFAFKADPEYVKILSNSSVEAANLANNHSHDYGEKSYQDTKNTLEANKIKTFGYDDVTVLNVKGVDVGIYGIYELDDHLDRIPQLKSNIQKLKDMNVDLIVGIFHWSNELVTFPDDNQLILGRMAVDLGTDIVVGHHPHVIQGIENYKGKNIVYSLGNFCFGGNVHPTEMDTYIYQETFTIGTDRKIIKSESNIIPCSVSSEYGFNNYQPTPMTGEEAESEMQKIEERSEGISEAEPVTM